MTDNFQDPEQPELEVTPAAEVPQPQLTDSERFDEILARIDSGGEVSDEELDWAEAHRSNPTPAPANPEPELVPEVDPLAEAFAQVGAKSMEEFLPKLKELRGKVGEIGSRAQTEIQELRALAEQREKHERFVTALLAGDPAAIAALEKHRSSGQAPAAAQTPADGEELDVLDPVAWREAKAARAEAQELRNQMAEFAKWQQQQLAQDQAWQANQIAYATTMTGVAAMITQHPELADATLAQDLERYYTAPDGQDPRLGDSARTIVEAMELGQKLGSKTLAEAYAAFKALYPDRVPKSAATQAPAPTPAPKQPMPGLAAVRAKGQGGGLDAYSDEQIRSGDFPANWLNEDGSPNYSAIPQQYHSLI